MRDDEIDTKQGVSRRRVVVGAGLAAGAIGAPAILRAGRAKAAPPSALFTLGVASGDPGPDYVVLWTRLAPDPLNGGGMPPVATPVTWEVATDEAMLDVVAGGEVTALPEHGHAVHVSARGLPRGWLYYRFRALGETSRVGRTRTFPAAGEAVERMRFAVVSCQHYEQGYYPAWRDIAAWRRRAGRDIDFVVHTGDYIYEGAADPSAVFPDRVHVGGECVTVDDYRNRYAQYRLDRHLQDAHANYPFIVTPDDHEVENNYAGGVAEESSSISGAAFLERRRNAYQVYGESMPLRFANRVLAADGSMRLHRRLIFGSLARIHVLDTRQHRSDQPAGDSFGSTDPLSAGLEPVLGERLYDPAGILDPNATMMGAEQEQWLIEGLSQSNARWNIIAQQVMLTRWNLIQAARLTIANTPVGPTFPQALKDQALALANAVSNVYNVDAWDGYPAARQRLFDVLASVRPNNPIVLTGDIHAAWAANLLADFDDPANSGMVAAEFVCTSIASTFLAVDPRPTHAIVKASLPDNPHIAYFNGLFRGYCLCEVDHDRFKTHFRAAGGLSEVATPDPLALAPRENTQVATDAVASIRAGFNAPGSSERIQIESQRTFPAPL